jgi:hypothetical protein
MNAENMKPKAGDLVVLAEIPAGFLDNLPAEDRQAIREVVGKPILLTEYDERGKAQLEFIDRKGVIHFVYVSPSLIRKHHLKADEVLRRYNDESLPDFCEPLTDVNQVGTFGNRPLHLASYRGDIADVIALVEGGADINAVGDLGSTPLHEAVDQGHIHIVRFLLKKGASLHVTNELGKTPLDVAKDHNRDDIAQLLRSV